MRDALQRRMSTVDDVDAEYRQAVLAMEEARAELRSFYASVEPGETPDRGRERALMERVQAAEEEAAADFAARKEGRALGIEQARRGITEFIQQHWAELSAELLPESVRAQQRVAAAMDELEAGLHEWARVLHEWQGFAPAAGISPGELPRMDAVGIVAALPGDVPVPAPSSLLGNVNGTVS